MSAIRAELDRLDIAVYAAVANTRTPRLDRALGRLSHAADFSKLWLGSATALALAGGPQGRRAAVNGVASLGLTSAVVNIVLKPLFGRRRPERVAAPAEARLQAKTFDPRPVVVPRLASVSLRAAGVVVGRRGQVREVRAAARAPTAASNL